MAGERTLPGLGLTGFWDLGSDGWKGANDTNLLVLSALVNLSVISATTALPGSPTNGDIYIVPSGGDATKVAVRDAGAWVLLIPQEGWRAWIKDTDRNVIFDGSVWRESQAWIGLGGATPDATNRLAANTPSVLFNHAGDDINVTLNKDTTADDARVNFQTGFSTRALVGLLADDDFSISVSPDGAVFHPAVSIDKDTGHIGLNGYTADAGNALGVKGTAFLFDADTDDCRFTFNKVAAGDDVALTFQSGYSARALVGLLGDDDFTFKVSPDGSVYKTALIIDKDTGANNFPEHSKFSAYVNFDRYVAATTWTLIDNNNARHNDQGDWASGGLFTAPHDGYYVFGAGYRFKANSTVPTDIRIGLSVDAATPTADRVATTGDATIVTLQSSVHITGLLKLTAGQTVSAQAFMTGFDGYVQADANYFWGAQIA